MMKHYKTRGVCAQIIGVDTDGKTIRDVEIIGGCRGQAQALPRLVRGRDIDDVIERLRGNPCRHYNGEVTSCADQLARILEREKKEHDHEIVTTQSSRPKHKKTK